MSASDWIISAILADRERRQERLLEFDRKRDAGARAAMKYICDHHHLVARVWSDGPDLWIEGGAFKHSRARAAELGITNPNVPRRVYDLDNALLFVGQMWMPDGSIRHVDGTKAIVGCRCRAFVVSLVAIRHDAENSLVAGTSPTVTLPDSSGRVVVAEQ